MIGEEGGMWKEGFWGTMFAEDITSQGNKSVHYALDQKEGRVKSISFFYIMKNTEIGNDAACEVLLIH